MNPRPLLLIGLTAAAFLLGSVVPTPTGGFGATSALAKAGKGDGGGSGGGHGIGGGKGSAVVGEGDGPSAGTGGTSPPHGAPSAGGRSFAVDPPEIGALDAGAGPNRRSLDARLSALPAANANLLAFIHASPNSQLGRLAAYARALAALEGATAATTSAEQSLIAAQDALADATVTRDTALHQLLSMYPTLDPTNLQAKLNELDNIVQDGGGDAEIKAEIAAINNVIAAEAALATAQACLDDATATLADAQAAANAAGQASETVLAAAASEVQVEANAKAYVDDKLLQNGILDYYRSLTRTSSSAR